VTSAVSCSLNGTSEELDVLACSDKVRLHAYSRHACEPYKQSTITVAGEKAVEAPPHWDIRLVSATGMKGGANSPNQDAFSFTHLTSGWFFCLACDGHGEEGEVIAERVSRTIPLLLARHLDEAMSIEEALPQAFLGAQSDLERSFKIDQIYSGTTVVMCCIHLDKNEVFLAHTGDSRAVLGDLSNARVLFSTDDHKAHDPPEYERLKRCGAQVIRKKYDDGEIISRVFIPRTGVPGLAMSRSLGDGCLKKYGVIAEPEVNNLTGYWDKCEAPAILAGSDGLWDTISVEDAIQAISARHQKALDIKLAAEVLCRRAQRMWIEAEDDYCDDVTVLIMAPQKTAS
jgi:serine/threonine protein phosphatase PrpC